MKCRQALTCIHTAIPSAIPGLSIERIRLLCFDELKDKLAATSSSFKNVLSDRNIDVMKEKDLGVLDQYVDALSFISEDLTSIEHTLVPTLRSWSASSNTNFSLYEQRLMAISRQFDELQPVIQRFVQSAAHKQGTARSIQARIQRAAATISSPDVRASLDSLETLVLRRYDSLEQRTKTHLESHYLQTLELVLEELGRAEQDGEDTAAKAALCFRAISVLSTAVSVGSQMQRDLSERSLEAEVVALERIAAIRGDIAGSINTER